MHDIIASGTTVGACYYIGGTDAERGIDDTQGRGAGEE
jgi:hypothetical protein